MNLKFQITVGASALSALAFAAPAQELLNPKAQDPVSIGQRGPQLDANRLHGTAKASEIIGMEVQNYQNEKVGKIHDLDLDVESGRIVQVILSTGGFFGVGSKLNASPPGALRLDVPEKILRLDASKEKLGGAPAFEGDETSQSNRVAAVYAYYGERTYFVADGDGSGKANKDLAPNGTPPVPLDETTNINTAPSLDKERDAQITHTHDDTTGKASTRPSDGARPWAHDSRWNGGKPFRTGLGYVQRASRLMGMPVKNLQDEKLGKVENFIVDLSAGRIVAVILSTGGFMEMGGELSAVPPTSLRFNPEHDTLQLDATKDLLTRSPHFKSTEWPDLGQPGYAGEVYRAYKVEPYFAEDAAGGSNNTRLHGADREKRELTPLDQSNTAGDVNTTAQVRKEVMSEKGMSVNGKNVKIVTIDGRVTLRGPVDSQVEKQTIGDIANRIARAENVDNQLEVKLPANSNN